MSSFDYLIDESERMEALLSHLQADCPSGWRPHRILFRNFWFFQKEEFLWHHGRIFLGGQNAAGKSTVLSMAVPFLLDGNKSEERLNTFGGQGRHMAYYVTGSPSPDDTAEAAYFYPVRTSYLALEFCRQDPSGGDQYLTFGQGLHHDRSSDDKSVRSWGFVVRDGRRVGRSYQGEPFDLVRENHTCLNRGDLKKLLGSGGEVFDTNRDYRREVNRLLFGFKDLADFDSLIDLLLQIRRPKLTKEVRPRDVADILTQSLPPLDERVMQVTATSLDHIDQTTQNLEQLAQQIDAATAVERATRDVFRRTAEGAAAQFEKAGREADAASTGLAAKATALTAAVAERERAVAEMANCQRKLAELDEEQRALQGHEAIRSAEDLSRLEREIAEWNLKLAGLKESLRKGEADIKKSRWEIQTTEDEWAAERAEGLELISEAEQVAEAARWETAAHWAKGIRARWEQLHVGRPDPALREAIPRTALTAAVAERTVRIGRVEQALRERDSALTLWQGAERAEQEALQRYLEADAAATVAANLFSDRRQAAGQALRDWPQTTQGLTVEPAALEPVAQALERYLSEAGPSPRELLAPLYPHVQRALGEVAEQQSAHQVRLRELKNALAKLRGERARLDEALPEPGRDPEQEAARAALLAAGIPFAPLYELVAFGEAVPPATAGAVEQALLEMGLLDALVVELAHRSSVLSLLRRDGLSERLLLTDQAVAGLSGLLHPDPAHPLAAALNALLGAPANVPVAAVSHDAGWQHGLLAGVSRPSHGVRYIGRAARERFRQAEIDRLDVAIRATLTLQEAEEQALADLAGRAAAIRADWERLERLEALSLLERTGLEHSVKRQQVEAEKRRLGAARERKDEARNALHAVENQLAVLWREFPEAQGLDLAGLQGLAKRTQELKAAFDGIYYRGEALLSKWENLATRQAFLHQLEAHLDEHFNQQEEGALQLRRLVTRQETLQKLIQRPDVKSLFERLAAMDRERPLLDDRRVRAARAEAVASDRMTSLQEELPALRQRAQETATEAANQRQRLHDAVHAYPTLEPHRFPATDDEAARRIARAILGRWTDRPSLIEDIRKEEMSDRSALSGVFGEHRQILRNYYPDHQPKESTVRLVQFNLDGILVTPHQLVQHLAAEQAAMRNVLQQHEADLFERHLLQEVGREVRRCLLKAQDWVDEINDLLERYPLRNEEKVWLDWSPKQTEHELGGTIARHVKLLRHEESDLTPAQRDTLKSAFQEEIRQIREQAKRGEWRADVFRAKLAEVLDYRIWHRFRIFIRGGVAGRTEITDTVHNARSGSERALVLLLPLLAGLSVRYDNASREAPRLLALDEGFAGIDAMNSRQLIRFLTALNLVWVVSSEKLPALTEDLPGASFYAMLREGTVVATRPFVWDGQRLREADTGEAPDHGG